MYNTENSAKGVTMSEEELKAKLDEAIEALIWCSGSADFGDGGKARVGWLKICKPIIDRSMA